MAKPTLPDLAPLINEQIELRQALRIELCKASALLRVSLENETFQTTNVTGFFYLLGVSDHVEQSRELNETALSRLLEIQLQCAEITVENS